MSTFWAPRIAAYRAAAHDAGSRRVLLIDVLRMVTFGAFFFAGLYVHDGAVGEANRTGAVRFMIALCTFGTFLASFVLAVMASTGKRELDLMPDASTIRRMADRLGWLLSDQLIMVVSALATAASALLWLGLSAFVSSPPSLLTAAVLGFGALALLNAVRLPLQMWELQSSALVEEKQRAFRRLNKELDEVFKE